MPATYLLSLVFIVLKASIPVYSLSFTLGRNIHRVISGIDFFEFSLISRLHNFKNQIYDFVKDIFKLVLV
jgi:hypothetical protein